MKLLITIVQAYDSDRLLKALTTNGFGATRINSVGGFLRMVNTTILIGLEQERLPEAIALINSTAKRRVEVTMDATAAEYSDWLAAGVHEVPIGGAVLFVMELEALYKVWPTHIEKQEKETPV